MNARPLIACLGLYSISLHRWSHKSVVLQAGEATAPKEGLARKLSKQSSSLKKQLSRLPSIPVLSTKKSKASADLIQAHRAGDCSSSPTLSVDRQPSLKKKTGIPGVGRQSSLNKAGASPVKRQGSLQKAASLVLRDPRACFGKPVDGAYL